MILLNQLPNKAGGIPRLLSSYVMGLWDCNQHQLFQINTAGVGLGKIHLSSSSEALSRAISHLRRLSCQQPPDLGGFEDGWGGYTRAEECSIQISSGWRLKSKFKHWKGGNSKGGKGWDRSTDKKGGTDQPVQEIFCFYTQTQMPTECPRRSHPS